MKIKEIIKEEFKSAFEGVQEVITNEVKTEVEKVESKVSSLQNELAEIKSATQEVHAKTGMSKSTLEALGNTTKSIFGVEISEDALTLKAPTQIDGSVSGSGAELMFVDLHEGIITLAESYGVLLRDASKFTSRERTYKLVFGQNSTAHGGYDTESANRDSEKETFGKKEVTLQKWRKIIGVSMEALEDSAPEDLGAYIAKKLSEHYGLFMDAQIHTALVGSASAPVQVTSGATGTFLPTYEDLIDITAKPQGAVLGRSAFYMHRQVWASIRKIKDGAGSYVVQGNKNILVSANGRPVEGQPVGYIDGYPVYLSDEFATPSANAIIGVFGDMSEAVAVIQRKGFGITSDSSEKFSSDIVLVKGMARNAVSLLHDGTAGTTGSGVSAYALLKSSAT